LAGITHLKEFKQPVLGRLAKEVDKHALEIQDDILGFLPDEDHYDLEFAYNVVKTTSQMGAMIGFGSEPPIRDRDEVAKRMGEIAKYGWKDIVTENELLKLHNPRNDGEFKALVESITANGAKMVKETRDRINVSKLQAIGTGQVTYDDNNVKITIDYTEDMPEDHKIVLTGDNTWANPEHDVIGDLIEWNEQYEETNNGKKADAIYLTRKAQALLLKNTVIVNEVSGMANSGRNRVNVEELNTVLGAYDLPPVRLIKKTSARVKSPITGQVEKITLFPENRVLFISDGIGTFKMGPTVENGFQPGIILQAYDNNEPIQSILRTAAAGFPVIENPGLLLYADVIPEEGAEG